MIDTDCSGWYTNRQNWYSVVCISIVYINLHGIIFHEYHYIRISVLTDPFLAWLIHVNYLRLSGKDFETSLALRTFFLSFFFVFCLQNLSMPRDWELRICLGCFLSSISELEHVQHVQKVPFFIDSVSLLIKRPRPWKSPYKYEP